MPKARDRRDVLKAGVTLAASATLNTAAFDAVAQTGTSRLEEDLRRSYAKEKLDILDVFKPPSALPPDTTPQERSLTILGLDLQQTHGWLTNNQSFPSNEASEIVRYYEAVLKDGRYTRDWWSTPQEKASSLGISLSSNAATQIGTLASHQRFRQLVMSQGGEGAVNPVIVGAIVVVIVFGPRGSTGREVGIAPGRVLDPSAVSKY